MTLLCEAQKWSNLFSINQFEFKFLLKYILFICYSMSDWLQEITFSNSNALTNMSSLEETFFYSKETDQLISQPKNLDQIRHNSGCSVCCASNECLFFSAWERSRPTSSLQIDWMREHKCTQQPAIKLCFISFFEYDLHTLVPSLIVYQTLNNSIKHKWIVWSHLYVIFYIHPDRFTLCSDCITFEHWEVSLVLVWVRGGDISSMSISLQQGNNLNFKYRGCLVSRFTTITCWHTQRHTHSFNCMHTQCSNLRQKVRDHLSSDYNFTNTLI